MQKTGKIIMIIMIMIINIILQTTYLYVPHFSTMCYQTKFQNPILSCETVTPDSPVATAVLSGRMVFIPIFMKIRVWCQLKGYWGGIEFRSIVTKVKLKGPMRKNMRNVSKC